MRPNATANGAASKRAPSLPVSDPAVTAPANPVARTSLSGLRSSERSVEVGLMEPGFGTLWH